jgi:hypothetical protein
MMERVRDTLQELLLFYSNQMRQLKVKQETKNMLLELCIEIDVQIVFSAS